MSKIIPHLGKNISALRELRGFSQSKVADGVGVARKTIYNWESGKSGPDADEIGRLAKVFGVSTREIIEQKNSHFDTEMISFREESVSSGDVPTGQKCREHLNSFLETCTQPEHFGWTLYELQDKFPLNKFKPKDKS